MASCVRNIRIKNYQNLIIGFQVTVKNVVDVFLRHSVHLQLPYLMPPSSDPSFLQRGTELTLHSHLLAFECLLAYGRAFLATAGFLWSFSSV